MQLLHLYWEAINTYIDTLCVLLEIPIERKTYSRSQKSCLEIPHFPGGCLVLILLGSGLSGQTRVHWTGGCFPYQSALLDFVFHNNNKSKGFRYRETLRVVWRIWPGVLFPVHLSPPYSLAPPPWQASLHECDSAGFCLSWLRLLSPAHPWSGTVTLSLSCWVVAVTLLRNLSTCLLQGKFGLCCLLKIF